MVRVWTNSGWISSAQRLVVVCGLIQITSPALAYDMSDLVEQNPANNIPSAHSPKAANLEKRERLAAASMSRAEVKRVQQKLKEIGYQVKTVDGLMGRATRQAIMAFQRKNSFQPTGTLTPTQTKLLFSGNAESGFPDGDGAGLVDEPMTGSASDIQRALKVLGYYTGAVDGVVGSATHGAMRTFQRDKGFATTGELTAHQEAQLLAEANRSGIYADRSDVTRSNKAEGEWVVVDPVVTKPAADAPSMYEDWSFDEAEVTHAPRKDANDVKIASQPKPPASKDNDLAKLNAALNFASNTSAAGKSQAKPDASVSAKEKKTVIAADAAPVAVTKDKDTALARYLAANYSEFSQDDLSRQLATNYVTLKRARNQTNRGISVIKIGEATKNPSSIHSETQQTNVRNDVILVLKGRDYCDQDQRCIHEVLLRQSDGDLRRAATFLAPLSLEVVTSITNGYRDLAVLDGQNRRVWSFNGRKYVRQANPAQ